jgi:parallel beta-helix repeat protein
MIESARGAETIHVGGTGQGNYSSIGEAIDAASPGDIIFVHNDIYYENVYVNKTLTLQGESNVDTIIDSQERICVSINADNVTIKNFTVRNGSYGIFIGGKHNLITENLVINNYRHGIYVANASNDILNNTLLENSDGIYLLRCYDINILGNLISDNRIGISFLEATSNSVSENIITNNYWGIMLDKSPENTADNNIIMVNALFDIYISDRDESHISAHQNYFGTPHGSQINKRFQGDVRYSNWLSYKDPDAQYLNITTNWNGNTTLNKGLIVNGNLTIENATVTLNNSFGQNYILVSGNLTLVNSTFVNNKGNFTILYLNGTNGSIIDSKFVGQKGLVLQSERGMSLENNTITRGKSGLIITGGKYYKISNSKITWNGWSGYYQFSDGGSNSSSNSSLFIGIHIITLDGDNLFLNSASHNTIKNCEITGSDNIGIHLRSSSNNNISQCDISNQYVGVDLYLSNSNTLNDLTISNNYIGASLSNSEKNSINGSIVTSNINNGFELYEASYNSITRNTMNSNGGAGINLRRNSMENLLSNNTISENGWRGMSFYQAPRNTLIRNKLENNNESNLKVAEFPIGESMEQYIDDTNTVNGKPIYYFYGLTEEVIEFLDAGHITLAHSDNVIIQFSNVTNGDGVSFVYNTDSIVQYCNISNNLFGIYSQGGSNYTINLCNFMDNIEQVHQDSMIFQLDDGQIGNYWSDYNGEDANGDWIGDSPYFVKYNFKDNYPSFYPLYLDAPTPMIISMVPTNNEDNVSTNSSIYITFSREMNITSIENGIMITPSVNFTTYEWTNDDKTIVISLPRLLVETTYNIKINTSFKDQADNPLILPFQFSFTTEDAPTLVSTIPSRDATDIPTNTSITIIFSKEMNKTNVEKSISISPDVDILSYEWVNENKTLTLHFSSLSSRTTYFLSINTTATDLSGNPLTTYDWKFTTQKKEDTHEVDWSIIIASIVIGMIIFYFVIRFIKILKKPPPIE